MSGEGGDPPRDDVTRSLTVQLTPRSQAALNATVQLTDDTATDVVNRALQNYARLAEMGLHEGVYRLQLDVGMGPLYVMTSRTPYERKRRWWPW